MQASHYTVDYFFHAIKKGERKALSKAITLIESNHPDDQKKANDLIHKLLPYTGNSVRIGISGVPGVGKSTFIENFTPFYINKKGKVSILTVDPSSAISGGSILGDKLRMAEISNHESVFIRSSPANKMLGGVAEKTGEAIILCEAAGFKNIFVETVGTGQNEITVRELVDCFLFLLMPGSGDEIQGLKKGVFEIVDIFIINKADNNNIDLANKTKKDIENILDFLPKKISGWKPAVINCSSIKHNGFTEIIEAIDKFIDLQKEYGCFEKNRKEQSINWMKKKTKELLEHYFFHEPEFQRQILNSEEEVRNNKKNPLTASQELIAYFKQKLTNKNQ